MQAVCLCSDQIGIIPRQNLPWGFLPAEDYQTSVLRQYAAAVPICCPYKLIAAQLANRYWPPNLGSCEKHSILKLCFCSSFPAVECPPVPPPLHGFSTPPDCSPGSYQTGCWFSCEEGYQLAGSSLLTCGETGEWSHHPPNCQGGYIKWACSEPSSFPPSSLPPRFPPPSLPPSLLPSLPVSLPLSLPPSLPPSQGCTVLPIVTCWIPCTSVRTGLWNSN